MIAPDGGDGKGLRALLRCLMVSHRLSWGPWRPSHDLVRDIHNTARFRHRARPAEMREEGLLGQPPKPPGVPSGSGRPNLPPGFASSGFWHIAPSFSIPRGSAGVCSVFFLRRTLRASDSRRCGAAPRRCSTSRRLGRADSVTEECGDGRVNEASRPRRRACLLASRSYRSASALPPRRCRRARDPESARSRTAPGPSSARD